MSKIRVIIFFLLIGFVVIIADNLKDIKVYAEDGDSSENEYECDEETGVCRIILEKNVGDVLETIEFDESKPKLRCEIKTNLGKNDGMATIEIIDKAGLKRKIIAVYDKGKLITNVDKSCEIKLLEKVRPYGEVPNYNDTANHWAKTEIENSAKYGLFKGTTINTFAPNNNMTMEQLWMVVSRLQGEKLSTMSDAKKWVINNNYSDGNNEKKEITREEFVFLMWKSFGQPSSDYSLNGFSDYNKISSTAIEAFSWAVETGLINGVTIDTICPDKYATRAQISTVLSRFLK